METSEIHQSSLADLRNEVRRLDREILCLIGKRLCTSKRIGEAKSRLNLPIRDFKVEVEVLARARKAAEEFNFDPQLAEKVVEVLITSAVQTQVEHQAPSLNTGEKRVLLVGGLGRMGRWLDKFIASQGHNVHVCDPHFVGGKDSGGFQSLDQAMQQTWDAVILATPLGSTVAAFRAALRVPGHPLIFDIASLKGELASEMPAAAREGHRVTSIHPMFAPGAALLAGRTVLICDAGCSEATLAAEEFFKGTAASLFRLDLVDHDRFMSVLLGLSHAVNLLFGRSLDLLGLGFGELGKIASTTFSKQAQTAAEVSQENAALYHEIQHLNPHTGSVYAALEQALNELRESSLAADQAGFLQLMKSNRNYFFPSDPAASDAQ
jgi:chorismate mutase / prephenate dehydrogenase